MRNVLHELLSIEKKAKAIACEQTQEENIQAEIDRKASQIQQKAQAQIAQAARESQTQTEARLAQITCEYQQKTAQMEATYNRNHEQWVTEIMQHVIHSS
jgi:hypothetical protein